MSTSSAPAATAWRASATFTSRNDWPEGKAVATLATLTPLPRRLRVASATSEGHRQPAATLGIEASPGWGRIAFEHSGATLPGVSAPSSVVRSMQRMARSRAQSLEERLIERLLSEAARSSAPTWSTVRTPRISDPRWASVTAVAMGSIIHPGGPAPAGGRPRPAPLAPCRLEAVLTVDGPAPGRHEWHLRQLAAVAADHVVHDAARTACTVLLAPGVATIGAAAWLMLEPSRLIELLFAGGEYELPATVPADQHFVHVVQHCPLLGHGRWLTEAGWAYREAPARRRAILYPSGRKCAPPPRYSLFRAAGVRRGRPQRGPNLSRDSRRRQGRGGQGPGPSGHRRGHRGRGGGGRRRRAQLDDGGLGRSSGTGVSSGAGRGDTAVQAHSLLLHRRGPTRRAGLPAADAQVADGSPQMPARAHDRNRPRADARRHGRRLRGGLPGHQARL